MSLVQPRISLMLMPSTLFRNNQRHIPACTVAADAVSIRCASVVLMLPLLLITSASRSRRYLHASRLTATMLTGSSPTTSRLGFKRLPFFSAFLLPGFGPLRPGLPPALRLGTLCPPAAVAG